MEVVERRLDTIRPYERNPRRNDQAVDAVAASIREFGFKVPLVIDSDGVIVTGHTRYKAALRLGLKSVPCVIASDLSEEQIRAFRLADNKVGEISQWDEGLLLGELEGLDLDMGQFGFELGDLPDVGDILPPDYEERTQRRVENILNLAYGQYPGAGAYDTPIIKPVTKLPRVDEWIGFNFAMSEKEPEHKGVHFFVDDYQFERIWSEPERYAEILKRFAVVASPDFSPYGDMPLACQVYNHYRKHWCAAFWQERGITVIPTVRCSSDPRSLEWFTDGEPVGGIVMMSAMWSTKYPEMAQREYAEVQNRLKPKKVLIYGKVNDMGIQPGDKVEYIENFVRGRFES